MENPLFIAFAGVLLFIGLTLFFRKEGMQGLPVALRTARKSQDPNPIVDYISKHKSEQRKDLWDQAISQLWNSYDRELAAKVLYLALLPIEKHVVGESEEDVSKVVEPNENAEIKILHYWVTQVLQVEPEIAQEVFTNEFLQVAYRPDLASCCGKGCCG